MFENMSRGSEFLFTPPDPNNNISEWFAVTKML